MTATGSIVYSIIRGYAEVSRNGSLKYCEQADKVIYRSAETARRAADLLARLPENDPQYVYLCESSGDHYHLSRKPPRGSSPGHDWRPQHSHLARALMELSDQGCVDRRQLRMSLNWGTKASARGRGLGQQRLTKALTSLERREWVKRDGETVVILNWQALVDLAKLFSPNDPPTWAATELENV